MPKRRRSTAGASAPRQGPPILPIVLLISFAALVFYFIAESQRRNAEAHRLRLLAGFAERIESTVAELGNRFVQIMDLSLRPRAEGEVEAKSEIEQRVEWIDNLSLVEPRAVPRRQEGGALGRPLHLEADGHRLYLTYTWKEGEEPPTVTGEIDLEGVLQPIIIPEIFDSLLIADREGKVLVRAGDRKLRLTDVAALLEPKASGDNGGEEARVSMPLNAATRVEERRIADDNYLVFLQPITIRLRGSKDGGAQPPPMEWVACGLVSWKNLLSTSITGSPFLMLLLLSLFPLGLISWPFFKLALMSRRQRFQRADVSALVLATLLGVSLLTLLVLDLRFFYRFRNTVDQQLEELSGRIEDNLHQDLVEAYFQLRQLNRRPLIESLWDHPNQKLADGPRLRGAELVLDSFESVAWIDERGEQRAKLPRIQNALLKNNVRDRGYFRCAVQAELWTLSPVTERLRKLTASLADGLPSFAPLDAPSAGNGSSTNGDSDHQSSTTIRFCLESIRSRTTGRELAALSIDRDTLFVDVESSENGDRRLPKDKIGALAAAAIVFHPASITGPVLAPGFAFAVVEDGGRVLFHSDPRRNLTESFLKASDEDPVLASLIEKRRRGHLNFSYWGSSQRAFVQPLEPLPWSLVTYRSSQDLRLRNFELIYDFLNPFLLYTIFFSVAAAVVLKLRRKALDALWPDRELSGSLYRHIVLWTMVAIAGFSAVLAFASPVFVFYLSFLVPICAAALCCRGYRSIKHPTRKNEPTEKTSPAQEDGDSTVQEGDRARSSDLPAAREDSAGKRSRRIGPFFSVAEWMLASAALLASMLVAGSRREPINVFLALTVAVLFLLRWRGWIYFCGDRRRHAYVFALACILFLFGMLPALGFFELARERQYHLIVQEAQLGMAKALDRRLGNGGGGGSDSTPAGWSSETDYLGCFFDTRKASATASEASCHGKWSWAANREAEAGLAEGPLTRTASFARDLMRRTLSSRIVSVNDVSLSPVGIDLSRFDRDEGAWHTGRTCLLAEVPKSDGGEGQWRLESSIAAVHSSSWDLSIPGALSFLALGSLLLGPWLFSRVMAEKVLLISLVETAEKGNILDLLGLNGAEKGTPRVDGAPHRIFLVTGVPGLAKEGIENAVDDQKDGGQKRVAVRSFAEIRELTGVRRSDWLPFRRTPSGLGEIERAETLVVTDFRPDLSAPDAVAHQIEALEDLLARSKRQEKRLVVILSKKDPASSPADAEAVEGKVDPEARRMWNAFLASFIVRYGRDSGDPETFEKDVEARGRDLKLKGDGVQGIREILKRALGAPFKGRLGSFARLFSRGRGSSSGDEAQRAEGEEEAAADVNELLDTVKRECGHTRQLEGIGRQVLQEVEDSSTVEGLISKIGYLARSYYVAIWDSCNTDERVVLAQLARDGLANPKSYDSILDLIQRGLVVNAPALRLMNESFARFVRQRVERSQELRWQEEEGTSAWSVLKWLLPLPLLFLGGFLFLTQRDAFSNVVGFVLALGSVTPTLINLFGYFQQGSLRRRGTASAEGSAEG